MSHNMNVDSSNSLAKLLARHCVVAVLPPTRGSNPRFTVLYVIALLCDFRSLVRL